MCCWSCQSEVQAKSWKCSKCGFLQPFNRDLSHFEVLGLEHTYFLDLAVLEKKFKELLKILHPDRFVKKDALQRRFSLDWTTAINDAYRALKNPLHRAVYLLKWNNKIYSNLKEKQLDAAFLEEMLEQRSWLCEAKSQNDTSAVVDKMGYMKEKTVEQQIQLANLFKKWEAKKDLSALVEAAQVVAKLKYLNRFLEEAESMDQEVLQE